MLSKINFKALLFLPLFFTSKMLLGLTPEQKQACEKFDVIMKNYYQTFSIQHCQPLQNDTDRLVSEIFSNYVIAKNPEFSGGPSQFGFMFAYQDILQFWVCLPKPKSIDELEALKGIYNKIGLNEETLEPIYLQLERLCQRAFEQQINPYSKAARAMTIFLCLDHQPLLSKLGINFNRETFQQAIRNLDDMMTKYLQDHPYPTPPTKDGSSLVDSFLNQFQTDFNNKKALAWLEDNPDSYDQRTDDEDKKLKALEEKLYDTETVFDAIKLDSIRRALLPAVIFPEVKIKLSAVEMVINRLFPGRF